MHETVYTSVEVAYITGFSLRQLDYWVRKKMIVPSFQQANGSGSHRLYTVEDLVQLNIVRQLKKHNWSTQKIHKAIETLKSIMNDANPLRNAILFHGKDTIFSLSKTKEGERILIDALSTTGQQVMSFVFETMIEEIMSMTPSSDIDVSVEVYQVEGRELCH